MSTTPWFEEPKGTRHKVLFQYLRGLERAQVYRDREAVFNLGLYEDREVLGLAPGIYSRPTPLTQRSSVSLPLTGSCCDTATNHISQTKPLAMALTEGGDWLQQRRAKDLNHFLEGQYYSHEIFEEMQRGFGDCTWNGTGVIYVDREGNKPLVERVFPPEMLIDEDLSQFCDPMEMTRRKYIPKAKLKKLFPKHAAAIEATKPVELYKTSKSTGGDDLVAVYTTWRLPYDERHPGVKITIIENAELECRKYTRDYFPFVFIRWRAQKVGFWARGISSLGGRIQMDINRTFRTMSRSVALAAIPRLLLPNGSNVNPDHLTNEIGSGLWHTPGLAPSWMQGVAVPPEGMQHLQFEIQQYYQMIGISELAAGMKKPSGLNSGEAQRVYADTQADRFALPSQQYENASMGISKRLIDVAKEIQLEYGDLETLHKTTKGFRRIKWSEIELSEDEYTLKLWPINYLSKSPADLIDQVHDLIKMGMLTMKQAKRLIPFPDIEGVLEQDNAPEEFVQKVIEEIIEHDEYIPPDPVQDLAGAVQTMQLASLHYKTLGLPESKIEMMHTWIANAEALIPQPPAPPMPPPGAGPAGLPAPAPTMDAPPMMAPG